MTKERLTKKQKRFCEEYMIDMNGKQAAIRTGYSAKTAEAQAARLLRYVKVQDYISELRKDLSKKLGVTREMVLQEFARIAFSDIRRYYNKDGSLKPVTDLDEDSAAALSGVEANEIYEGAGEERKPIGFIKKIRRFDKIEALANINKMMGWNAPEKIEHTGDSFLDFLMQTSVPRSKK